MELRTMEKLNDLLTGFIGKIELTLTNVVTGETDTQTSYNLFTSAGAAGVAQAYVGNYSNNQGSPTYCALGTDATAPTITDTALGGEIARKLISVRNTDPADANTAVFEIFFNVSEGNGTLREIGLFGGSANQSANTGTLFNKAAINRTKTSSDTLSIRYYFTIGSGL
jgi:hypothetical protein